MNNDTIFLRDLRIETIIGINDWERTTPQTVVINLDMAGDAASAARSDRIDATLNYKAVAKRLIGFVETSQYQLVETLAERIATIVRTEFRVCWVRVSVHKPGAVRGSRDVGIVIERGRRTQPSPRREVYISVGSNIEADKNLRECLAALEQRFGPVRRSTVYRNAPIGFEGEDFLNLVVGFETAESLPVVAAALDEIEIAAGRRHDGPRYGPRTLDLDLLTYGDEVVATASVNIPRGQLLKFPFMLRPLAELAGDRVHPVAQRCYADLWRASGLAAHTMTPVAID